MVRDLCRSGCRGNFANSRSFLLFEVARLNFFGGYLLSLSVNYVAMSKDMEKKITTTVLYKDENFL